MSNKNATHILKRKSSVCKETPRLASSDMSSGVEYPSQSLSPVSPLLPPDPEHMSKCTLLSFVKTLYLETKAAQGILNMIDEIDNILEDAICNNWSTIDLMERLLPAGHSEMPGAKIIFIRTMDETLGMVDFHYPNMGMDQFGLSSDQLDNLVDFIKMEGSCRQVINNRLYLGSRLDVSNLYVGAVVVLCDTCTYDAILMRTVVRWGEVVDNFIGDSVKARRKDLALKDIFEALRLPVLDDAIDAAINVLRDHVPFHDLVLVVYYDGMIDIGLEEEEEDDAMPLALPRVIMGPLSKKCPLPSRPLLSQSGLRIGRTRSWRLCKGGVKELTPRLKNLLNYRIVYQEGQTISMGTSASVEFLDQLIVDAYSGKFHGLTEHCQLVENAREEFSIYKDDGITKIGRVSLGLDHPINPFCRDIMLRACDNISQRLSVYNKEWRQLSRNFCEFDVRTLLRNTDYYNMYLAPREQMVAIVYCDITGFTWLSETVLKKPSRIGDLIDRWSNKAVEYIWQSGGVFDKMVGDCIIGLWGPPFFSWTPTEACHRALQVACCIREFSRVLISEIADLSEGEASARELGVAIGINYCPLMVGTYGPDNNYTGFSSGMNNTARLQGLAKCNQIFCMESFVKAYDSPLDFSPPITEKVKNVADPIRFCSFMKSRPQHSDLLGDAWLGTLSISATPPYLRKSKKNVITITRVKSEAAGCD